MKRFTAVIEGIPVGLMMHRCPTEAALENPVVKRGGDPDSAEAIAEGFAYRTAEGELYLDGHAIQLAMTEAAAGWQVAGKGRKTWKSDVQTLVGIRPHEIVLRDKEGKPIETYTICTSTVPNAQGNRVVCHRPLIPEWQAQFEIEVGYADIPGFDDIPDQVIRQILVSAGGKPGVGAFRTNKDYGKFMVVSLKRDGVEIATNQTVTAPDDA